MAPKSKKSLGAVYMILMILRKPHLWTTRTSLNYKFIKLQPFIRFVDVSATTAAIIRMTVHRPIVILMKAAVVAETSTNLIKGCNLMNL